MKLWRPIGACKSSESVIIRKYYLREGWKTIVKLTLHYILRKTINLKMINNIGLKGAKYKLSHSNSIQYNLSAWKVLKLREVPQESSLRYRYRRPKSDRNRWFQPLYNQPRPTLAAVDSLIIIKFRTKIRKSYSPSISKLLEKQFLLAVMSTSLTKVVKLSK